MGWCLILTILVTCHCLLVSSQQRVAPGVPPQQYANQGVPHHQMHQQMPQQMPQMQQVPQQMHQQMPQQMPQMQQVPQQMHQQMPVQQQQQMHQQVPVQHQQPMYQQAPEHGHHQRSEQQILHTSNIQHEKQHIKEHMEVPVDMSKMSEQELQFHYFKMHDTDNNNKLDGCELIKSLIHWHEQGHHDPNHPAAEQAKKIFGDEELVQLIDPILKMDDSNSDGYIDYPEFVRAQHKAAAASTGGAGRR